MRQVNRDELIFKLRFTLSRAGAALLKDLAAGQTDRRDRARTMLAEALADALGRYDILSSAPLNHPAGDALFERAARGGYDRESGIPPSEE